MHLLQRRPWRVAVARIPGHAAGLQRRRGRDRHVQRPICDRRRPAEIDHDRLGSQRILPSLAIPTHAQIHAASLPERVSGSLAGPTGGS